MNNIVNYILLAGIVSVSLPALGQETLCAVEVSGDSPCSPGESLITYEEALTNASSLCSLLGTWDIVRLADGGSMDGPGYGCGIRNYDSRPLGDAWCKQASSFSVGVGDGVCAADTTMASVEVAQANEADACSVLGPWYIARLAGGGSMDGSGYGCGVGEDDTRSMGHTLCASYDFSEVHGDLPCTPGERLLTPNEARANAASLCSQLGTWDIARLAGGGSMDGPGYGCGIRDYDSRGLGDAICTESQSCLASPNDVVTVGPVSPTALAGNPSGGTFFNDSCGENSAVVGIQGEVRAGDSVLNLLGAVCAPLVLEGDATGGFTVTTGPTVSLPQHGRAGVSGFTALCPEGQAVVGYAGRDGLLVDQLELNCAPFQIVETSENFVLSLDAPQSIPPVGGNGGSAFILQSCPVNQVATSVFIRAGDSIDAFAVGCQEVSLSFP